MKKECELRFVTAHRSEALPIIEFYNLNLIKTDFSKLKLFTNKKKSIWLVISGTGRKKAFEASRALNKTSKDYSSPLWINIGIAGHENFNVGSIYEIKKVILNHNKKKALYTNSLSSYFNVHTGCNVNKEEKLYKNSYIYDMESFGFLSAVELFALRERIFIFKIISDNLKCKLSDYKTFAYNSIKKNIYSLSKYLEDYFESTKIKDYNYKKALSLISDKYHITFYNKKKLETILPKLLEIKKLKGIQCEIDKSDNLKNLLNSFEIYLKNYILKI